MNFIKLTERRYDNEIIVNVDCIALIWPVTKQIIVTGNHGEGNGLFPLTDESFEKVMKYIEEKKEVQK